MSIQGLPQTGSVTLPPSVADTQAPTVQPGSGLAQIGGAVPITLPPRTEVQAPQGHPADGLGQIARPSAQPATRFDSVTGKAEQIRQALHEGGTTRVEDKVADMTRGERKEMKSLLHFPWYSRGDTTAESRLQIRAILSDFIAQGGSMEQAKALKASLKAGDQTKLPGMLAAMIRQADPGHGLPDLRSQHLATRIATSSENEQTRIAALLSAPVDAGAVDQAARHADTRTILAGCLAQGMPVDQADTLKTLLSGQPASVLDNMSKAMGEPATSAHGALSTFLLAGDAVGGNRLETVRTLLQAMPVDVTRAGLTEHVDGNATLVRDAHGRLDCAFASAGVARIGSVTPYPTLSAIQLNQVRDAFATDCAPRYSRMGIPLDMMGAFAAENTRRRDNNPQEAPISLGDFKRTWDADGTAAMNRYGKGDCMTAAQTLVQTLADQGITAHLGGVQNQTLMQQRHGANAIPADGKLNTMGITHTDVLVPYRSESGEDRVMLITPGMGNLQPERFCRDLPASDPDVAKCRVGVAQQLDPSDIQKSQLGFLTNLLINDRAWDARDHNIVGIDLVKGTMGLSGAATTRFRAAHGTDFAPGEQTALVFNYRDAMANPGQPVTVKVWDADRNDYDDRTITKLQALGLFLRDVQVQFAQPPEFVANTMALLSNERAYHADVLWPSTRAINQI